MTHVTATEVALIMSATGTLLTAVGQAWNNWNGRRIEKNTNSMKDALVAATKAKAFDDGKADEKRNPS